MWIWPLPARSSEIESFDAATSRFKLKQPRAIKAGDRFEVFPRSANWNIHDNTITGCLQPVVLDSNGSPTSLLRDNLISRGEATDAKQGIQVVRGQFELTSNRMSDIGPTAGGSKSVKNPKR